MFNYRFLFIGDGRPANNVTITPSIEKSAMYDRVNVQLSVSSSAGSSPSSSGGSSFKLSFNGPAPTVVKKSAEYDSADVDDEEVDLHYDYAFNTGPFNKRHSMLPISSTPPPINLVSHPSRKKDTQHRRSLSIPSGKTNITVDAVTDKQKQFHSSTDSGLASTISLEDDFQMIDESLSQIMSDLQDTTSTKTEDDLTDLIAQLESFATSNDDDSTPLKRSNTLPLGKKKAEFRRANSTSTCQPMHYMRLRNPKADLMNDGYIMMGSGGRAYLDKVPEEKNSVVPKTNCVTEPDTPDTYMNHPLPPDIAKATPIIYQRDYENITHNNNPTTNNNNEDDEAIYMNHDQAPATDKEMEQLFSSAWNEIDNLQLVLDQLGVTD